jgi:hypothetical protein
MIIENKVELDDALDDGWLWMEAMYSVNNILHIIMSLVSAECRFDAE